MVQQLRVDHRVRDPIVVLPKHSSQPEIRRFVLRTKGSSGLGNSRTAFDDRESFSSLKRDKRSSSDARLFHSRDLLKSSIRLRVESGIEQTEGQGCLLPMVLLVKSCVTETSIT